MYLLLLIQGTDANQHSYMQSDPWS